jgi:succinate dehydrogenase / fumarate reductase iron-sulfur subunit
VSSKISQYALLPQGRIEAKERVRDMVLKMDELGFGNCSNTGACEAECPKQIKLTNIARIYREFYKAF